MAGEFDPAEYAREFQQLWGRYRDARKALSRLEGAVELRAPGETYSSGEPMTVAEYAAARDRVESTRRAVEEYCNTKGLPHPSLD
jgi:hypothetical protein